MSDPTGGEPPGYQPPSSLPPPPPNYAAGSYPPANPYQQYPQVAVGNPYDSRATTVLILGILGLVLCQLLGIFAWVQGKNLRDEALAAGYPEPSNCQIGRILGMVATGLIVAGLVFAVFWIVLVLGMSAGG